MVNVFAEAWQDDRSKPVATANRRISWCNSADDRRRFDRTLSRGDRRILVRQR